LTTNKFKSAEAQKLRLAFEEVTGQDLNWYWNQWYYSSGHPKLTIDYAYDDAAKKVQVIVNQTQESGKIFRLPIAIDIYNGATKTRNKVWIENKADTFTFAYNGSRPDLVNVDGDKILLCEKKDNKTLENYLHQYKYAGGFVDRREAVEFCSKHQDDPKAVDLMKLALKDKYYRIRNYTLQRLDFKKEAIKSAFEPLIAAMAENDQNRLVKAKAIDLLGSFGNPSYKSLFVKATSDSSYSVAGNALGALAELDSAEALSLAKKMQKSPAKGELSSAISAVLIRSGSEADFDVIADNFEKMPTSQNKFEMVMPFTSMLTKVKSTERVKRGVDLLIQFKEAIPQAYRKQTDPFFDNALNGVATQKLAGGMQDQADYIRSKVNGSKKAF
ncbi:MAG TPA: HEAT repeat domain-containing protein, partial [Puia sp.]